MTRLGVVLFSAVTLLFIVALGAWGVSLITIGGPLAIVAGVAVLFFALLGAWGVWSEVAFGLHAARLGRALEASGDLPPEEVALHPSGRIVRSDAEALLDRYEADAAAHPDDWRAAFRLGLVLDGTGERRAARGAIRQAIRLEKNAR